MDFRTAKMIAIKYGLESIYDSWKNRKGFYFKGYEDKKPCTMLIKENEEVLKKEGKHYVLL